MILVTGGTGFVGQALIRHLVEASYPVRTLIRPSQSSPQLPFGVPVEVAVSSLTDGRGIRAAMVGVDTVYHLASSERRGGRASLMDTEIEGTRAVVDAAVDAGVQRFFLLSHLGSDRASAFPVMKAKAIAEEFVRRSGIDFTIIRSAVVYGANDGLTTGIARLLSAVPYVFLLPGKGETLVQPIWIEDLVTCLTWALDDPELINRTVEIGGPEYLSFRQVVEVVMAEIGIRRRLISLFPPYLRGLTVMMEAMFSSVPTTVYWLDYLAANRTTSLDTVPRIFGLLPARMHQRVAYLKGQNWRVSLIRTLLRGRP